MTSFVPRQIVYIQGDLHLKEVVFHHCKKFLLLRGVLLCVGFLGLIQFQGCLVVEESS